MGNLKSFKIFYEEVVKPIVVTFGRFNPPTIGHEKLLNAVSSTAGKKPYRIYVSQSQDKKKNPLPYDEKIKFLRKMFPRYARNIIDDTSIKTIFDIAVKLNTEGFTHFILVVGSDRVSNFKELLDKYNGVKAAHGEYKFESIEVVSAGERDPDSDEVSAMSASKLRAAAAEGDLSAFLKGLPNGFGDVQDLFNAVRKGMGLEEMVQFRRHIELPSISEIRDQYVKGEIFQEGTKVTHGDQTYTIKERKTNFVVCISESGKESKFWLKDIQPLDEGKGYYAGLSPSTAAKRKAHFDKFGQMDDRNPDAYEPAPGDANAETKLSKYTKAFKNQFGEEALDEGKMNTAIKNKAEKSGISYSILKQVFDRGVAAWKTGHRPGTTPPQWGLARVNSFIVGGKTRTTADADLWQKRNESFEESYDGDSFFEKYGILELNVSALEEAEYQGRKVELNKPMQGDVKKFKVYVKNKEGKVVKVNFGDPDMTIKKHIPARRKSFRARHKCDTDPADRDTARYWSCKKW
jgi:hypothetical protein